MPDKQPFREDGKSIAEKHGVFAVEARGESALAPAEVESLRELREMVRTHPGRQEIREEIVARLVIITRKVFNDMEQLASSPKWWEAGVVRRGGTYLAELRRWLDTFPTTDDQPKDVTALLKGENGDKGEDGD